MEPTRLSPGNNQGSWISILMLSAQPKKRLGALGKKKNKNKNERPGAMLLWNWLPRWKWALRSRALTYLQRPGIQAPPGYPSNLTFPLPLVTHPNCSRCPHSILSLHYVYSATQSWMPSSSLAPYPQPHISQFCLFFKVPLRCHVFSQGFLDPTLWWMVSPPKSYRLATPFIW